MREFSVYRWMGTSSRSRGAEWWIGRWIRTWLIWISAVGCFGGSPGVWGVEWDDTLFRQASRVLQRRCLECHRHELAEGGLNLQTRASAMQGGDSGEVLVEGRLEESLLWRMVEPREGKAEMPKGRPVLEGDELKVLRAWILAGVPWPEGRELSLMTLEEQAADWWAYQPLEPVGVPRVHEARREWVKTPVDAFVAAKHEEMGLKAAAEADRRTLIRRLSYDLLGMPPTPTEVESFLQDGREDAYERLVDRYLASPAYGERWARHWLDIVHYADTHGYDKDKPREHAWPYRDYCIESFNGDKSYRNFIGEQIAGDRLPRPEVRGLGFLSAGPWDFIGHAEVSEAKTDGKVARHLDRDDMVQNTMLTFVSTTVGCAQCHAHKFDPITQEDYYSLQAVFAAVDRTEVELFEGPEEQARAIALWQERRRRGAELERLKGEMEQLGGERLKKLEERVRESEKGSELPVEYGYHSQIAIRPDEVKWVEVDLGSVVDVRRIEWMPCYDDFHEIGEGFGFPVEMEISISEEAGEMGSRRVVHQQKVEGKVRSEWAGVHLKGEKGRYVRVTAKRLAERWGDYAFALAELRVMDGDGVNVAVGKRVEALDSIEAEPRWRRENLVDGKIPTMRVSEERRKEAEGELSAWKRAHLPEALLSGMTQVRGALEGVERELGQMKRVGKVYVGAVHDGSGAFRGTGWQEGRPRPIAVLSRGDVTRPMQEVQARGLGCFVELQHHFTPAARAEWEGRQQLAAWISDDANPLTWRSIANRIWQYHFGVGLVGTANDFGRMGDRPSQPELLDYLANEMRMHGSWKRLHRMICTSSTYCQASIGEARNAELDPDNRYCWKAGRRRLEAEEIRDTILWVSGALDRRMYGESYRDFVIEHPEHSPHYEYGLYDPDDPLTLRRSIYRMIVRSQTQPFLTCLDCADPSLQVDRRNESNSAVQALAMLNDRLVIRSAERMAECLRREETGGGRSWIVEGYRRCFSRNPTEGEVKAWLGFIEAEGLENACRCWMNLNEMLYVD